MLMHFSLKAVLPFRPGRSSKELSVVFQVSILNLIMLYTFRSMNRPNILIDAHTLPYYLHSTSHSPARPTLLPYRPGICALRDRFIWKRLIAIQTNSIFKRDKPIHSQRILFGDDSVEVGAINEDFLTSNIRFTSEYALFVVIIIDLEDFIAPAVEKGKSIFGIAFNVSNDQVIIKAIVVGGDSVVNNQ